MRATAEEHAYAHRVHDQRYRTKHGKCYQCGHEEILYFQTQDLVLTPEEWKVAVCDAQFTAVVELCARCTSHAEPSVIQTSLDTQLANAKHRLLRVRPC